MKDTTDIIKRQILEFESEALQKFFKENILESFEEIEKYLEQRINIIEKKVEETLNTEKKNLDICMTVMNEEEYRLNDGVFSPVDMVDFSDKTKKGINIRNIITKKNMVVQTVYMELSDEEIKNLENRKFNSYIEKNGEKFPVKIRIEKNKKYNEKIQELYYLFQKNGREWKTINSFYNDNFYDIILDEFEKEYIDLQDIQNFEYDLEEMEIKAKKNVFLVWNINRISVQSEDFVQPDEERIVYKYRLDYNQNRNILINSSNNKPFFLVYRDEAENINVLSNEKQDLIWEVWEFMDFSNIKYEKELDFKIYSNAQINERIVNLNNKIRTKVELNRFLNSYRIFEGLKVDKIYPEIFNGTKYLKLKKLNEFIKFDFDLDERLKQGVTLKIKNNNIPKEEFVKLMSFFVSELEYSYPQYNFKVVDEYVE
ncbi:hypothetical protein JMUB3935_0306 [Leptotrichia trevisanii]|jgi:hypothetical protein|uniref:Uncharacterized protein n=1 Tax=Leptotrichia trevisanii TaxID=109328 RepID=A0A510KI36_9FUSO|nr:hypothetical protein [Leptotrichia trevisanii]BBM44192.1 hypothetical protein JMUB3870_0299 [Leptotrichia trevisanii]BBM51339.1 hypothetical protein JMUB3935_0306 [Leptotrichia trevisanii]